ncbi:MAG: hypothetical protein V3T20_02180 [Gemmatimonadota bacterium]|jgi:hypothetical protein
MKEYQVVIVRLSGKSHEDEDTLTDLLNERARGGWTDHNLHPLDGQKVVLVFTRET